LQTPAFYILLGEDEATKPKAYIGETENFRERVKDNDSKKAFWQKALLFISKDAAMTKADVQYLEHRAIAVAKTSNTFVLNENKQTPKAPNLLEPESNQNAAFVWVTFNHTSIRPHNPTSSSFNPTTSKDNNRAQKLKSFFSIIGENGVNLS